MKDEYRFLSARITDYKAYIDSSINYEVRDRHHYRDNAKVYKFMTRLEVCAVCTYPDDIEDHELYMTIYGDESGQGDFDLTLSGCHVRDNTGAHKYRKIRGKEVPVYDVPKGLGLFEKQRGENKWNSAIWVSPETITNMLTLLPTVKPLYISIHVRTVERNDWVVGFTLQTSNPDQE